MKSVCVIGGGIAGLSAAVFLAERNFCECATIPKVTIFERSPQLGGRAKSFYDSVTNNFFDNGQHLLIGAYKETLNFLSKIGAEENFYFQNNLEIPFVLPNGKEILFKVSSSGNELKRAFDILKLKTLSVKDRVKLLELFHRIKTIDSDPHIKKSITQFLIEQKQSDLVRERFWNIIAISTLNCSPDKASAKMFIDILKIIFFVDKGSSILIFPKYDLSHSYVEPAKEYLSKMGCEIKTNLSVDSITLDGNIIKSIRTSNGEEHHFDYYIFAVNFFELPKIDGLKNYFDLRNFSNLNSSPILAIYIWFEKNFFQKKFYSLVESPIQWIFNKGNFIAIVVSNASDLITKTKEEILNLCEYELKKYFPFYNEMKIIHTQIVKEKRATFIPDADSYLLRLSQKTKIKNLFLAGDWTNTGLPATLEGAVISAKRCMELIFSARD